jgi:hypothetical protein
MSKNSLFAAFCAVTAGLGTTMIDTRTVSAAPLHISGIEAPAPAVTPINHRRRDSYRYYRHRPDYWVPPAAFALGAIIGGAIAAAPPPYYGPPVYRGPIYRGPVYRGPVYRDRVYGGSAHANWCYNRYRSYRAWDNTFQPYHGPRRQCWSPYS